jgi:hypothetical protein
MPLYRSNQLDARFHLLPLDRRDKQLGDTESSRIRQYTADLPYYMTLSTSVPSLHSVVWSMFWQPDVECKLVGPWLSGILSVLRPLLAETEGGNITTLVNVLALRCPRVALWWLGLLLLGNPDVPKQLVQWLETTEGRYGHGMSALSAPDIIMAAWTGAPNSFWEQETATYQDPSDLVSWSDVLRCRFNHLLQCDRWGERAFAWKPSGHVRKADVELDIWPALEQGCAREYLHWIWWVAPDVPNPQLGFRQDTGRFVDDVPDDLDVVEPPGRPPGPVTVRKRPSIVAVGQMLSFFMSDVRGGIHESTAAMPGFEKHKWQKNWNLLPSGW